MRILFCIFPLAIMVHCGKLQEPVIVQPRTLVDKQCGWIRQHNCWGCKYLYSDGYHTVVCER